METIIDIIEFENEVLKFHIEKEYNIRKLSYDKQVNSINKVCSEKKMNKVVNHKELVKLQGAQTIKEENLFRIRLFIISVFIISFISLGIWWGFEGWGLFFSIIGTFFIFGGLGGLHIIPEFFEEYFCKVDPFPDFLLDRIRTDIDKIKDSNEKLTNEISTLENQLKSLQESSPKIEDVEKTINTKEFFSKNSRQNSRYQIEMNLQGLIGLSINSKQVQEYFMELGVKPEISKYSDCSHYSFESLGITFVFLNTDIIDTIWINSGDSGHFCRYIGYIPFNIRFENTQKEIEEKLGIPEQHIDGEDEKHGDRSIWENLGIAIIYKSENQKTKMNSIAEIGLGERKTNNISVQEKFSVVLKSSGISILAVCKTIRDLLKIDLKEAKYIVEAAPKVIKEGLWAYEANEIKAKLEEDGAEVEIVKTTKRY